jgi:hypothetical protein
LIFVAVPLVLYFTLAGKSKLFNDADTFWHIAVGQATLRSGLITHDPFSFTRNGQPWIANQWLAECGMALADSLGGLEGVLALTIAVLLATYLALASRWIQRGFDPLLTVAFVAFILSASAYTMNARPHLLSIGLLGLVFAVLRDIEDGRRPATQIAWLIPLFVLWSNLHGGVLGGIGTLLLVVAGWSAAWFLKIPSPITTIRNAATIWCISAVCALALFATPYGAGSFRAWLTIMSMSLPDLIIEHAPLHVGSTQGGLVVLLGIAYIVIFAATPKAWLRPSFWLPLVWLALTCQRIRHAPLFAMIAGVAMADLLPQSYFAAWLRRRHWLRTDDNLQNASDREASTHTSVASIAVAAIVLLVSVPLLGASVWLNHTQASPTVASGWVQPPPRVWPQDLAGALTSFSNQNPHGTPVFNEPILGGFLICNFPTLRVFVDGRCELYGRPFLVDVIRAWNEPSRLAAWQQEYGFRAALIEANSPLRRYFDNDKRWQRTAETPAVLFYERNEPDEMQRNESRRATTLGSALRM